MKIFAHFLRFQTKLHPWFGSSLNYPRYHCILFLSPLFFWMMVDLGAIIWTEKRQ